MGSGAQCTAAAQASLAVTNSRSLLKLMPIETAMPSNHLIFWRVVSSVSPPALHRGLFQAVSPLRQVARGLKCQLQPQAFQ